MLRQNSSPSPRPLLETPRPLNSSLRPGAPPSPSRRRSSPIGIRSFSRSQNSSIPTERPRNRRSVLDEYVAEFQRSIVLLTLYLLSGRTRPSLRPLSVTIPMKKTSLLSLVFFQAIQTILLYLLHLLKRMLKWVRPKTNLPQPTFHLMERYVQFSRCSYCFVR